MSAAAKARSATAIAATTACTLLLSACATTGPDLKTCDARMSAPLAPDRARICFVRQAAMLGAIVPHTVLDCGTGVEGNASFVETARWIQAAPGTIKQLFPPEGVLGTFLLERAAGRGLAQDKPRCFTIGGTPPSVQPNSDQMDAAYLLLPEDTLRSAGLSGTPIVSGGGYLWGISDKSIRPRCFVRLPNAGRDYEIESNPGISQVSGREAVKAMAEEVGQNARYLGTVRSGGTVTFDRPEGVMRLRVVTPGGDTAFAPDFPIMKGRRYVVVYTYGFSGVGFTLHERP